MEQWDVYLRLVSALKTANQQNRVHIALENRMSAEERSALMSVFDEALAPDDDRRLVELVNRRIKWRMLVRRVPRDLRQNLARWIRALQQQEDLSSIQGATPMVRLASNNRAHFYGSESGKRSGLIIGWAGQALRLMMPIANYLPSASQLNFDLLLLQPDRVSGYSRGIPRFGANFEQVVSGLIRFRESAGYENLAVMGTSLGSGPALVSAPRLGADRCLIVGLSDIEKSPYLPGWDELHRSWTRVDSPGLSITVGGDATRDVEVAKDAQRRLGGTLELIPGQGHAPVWELLKTGRFFEWFKESVA